MTENERIKQLEKEVARLQQEILQIKTSRHNSDAASFSVPNEVFESFSKAEQAVHSYFSTLRLFPEEGRLLIGDQRYLLLRADSMGYQMLKDIMSLYAERGDEESLRIARNLLFDIAHLLGKEDAFAFHKQMGLTDPLDKLSAGPVHFAYAGWARVELLDGSIITPNENFLLRYTHPNSFEAEAWIEKGEKAPSPVCVMNSGYSSGWCEESFGIELTAVELTCRACGDEQCSFIMAPPDKIDQILNREKDAGYVRRKHDIPLFFERKRMEESLSNSLREKEVMLKEIHHRVKNNLQIVSSLLNLQANSIDDPDAASLFRESQNRIMAMSLLHEALYSGNLSKVDSFSYMKGIINHIRMTFGLEYDLIHIDLQIDEGIRSIPIDTAIPCGLILNELLTNCMKHAFPDMEGHVQIGFVPVQDEIHELFIEDDGVGLPEHTERNGSVGLQIVEVLTEQLEGELRIDRNRKGTRMSIIFPLTWGE